MSSEDNQQIAFIPIHSYKNSNCRKEQSPAHTKNQYLDTKARNGIQPDIVDC